MTSNSTYCSPIEGANYGVKLSFEEELKKSIEKAKKEGKPLFLVGPLFSGKTNAIKRAVYEGIIDKNRDCIIEINKGLIYKYYEERLKKLFDENRFLIIEGNEYHLKRIFKEYISKEKAGKSDESNKIMAKFLELLEFFGRKKKDNGDPQSPNNIQIVEAKITKEDADKIFDYYVEEFLKKQAGKPKVYKSELMKKKEYFIKMAYFGDEEEIFIPQYLKYSIEKFSDKDEEELKLMIKEEREKEKVLLGYFGIGMKESNYIVGNILRTLKKFKSTSRSELARIFGSISNLGGIAVGIVSLLIAFYSRVKDVGLEKYMRVFQLWKEMSQEKQMALCSILDEEYKLFLGSSYTFLSSWFSKDETELKGKIEELLKNKLYLILENIYKDEKYRSALEKQQKTIESHEIRIRVIEGDLEKLKKIKRRSEKINYTAGTTRIKTERQLIEKFKSVYNITINQRTLVGIGASSIDKEVTDMALDIIKEASNKLVLIVGKPGSGKSTLLYIIGRELLKQGKKLYLIEDFDNFNFSNFSKLGNDAYAILDVGTNIDGKKVVEKISNIAGSYRSLHLIIAIRSSFVKDQEYLKKVEGREDVYITDIKMSRRVLLEIAKRNLRLIRYSVPSAHLTPSQLDSIALALVEKSYGSPLYISEAIKKISSEIKKRGEFSEDILSSLPNGISGLIWNIISEEINKSPPLLLSYYLVSHYPNFPLELLSSAEELFNIPFPNYANEVSEEKTVTLHSLYRDVTDQIFNGSYVEVNFTRAKVIKEKFIEKIREVQTANFLGKRVNYYIETLKVTLNKKGVLQGLKKTFYDFIYRIGKRVSLVNLADATMLFLVFHATKRELINTETRYGFMISKERVDSKKLDENSYQFYAKFIRFLLTTYLKNFKEEDVNQRPFYVLSMLYISRLLTGNFAKRVNEEFLGEKEPSLTLKDIARYYFESSKLIRLYISALVSLLEKIGYIKPRSKFEEGILLLCKGMYNEAIQKLDEAIRLKPDKARYHYYKGKVLRTLKRYDEAIKEFDEAIRLNPNKAEYHEAKGLALHYLKRYEEAIKEFDEAIKLDPSKARYHYRKGIALSSLYKDDEAIKEFDEAIRLNPNKAEYHESKGLSLHYLKKYEEAVEEFDKAIKLDPINPSYHLSKGRSLSYLKRYDEAIKEFDKAIKLDPTNPDYYYSKAIALKELHRFMEAIESLQMALNLSPGDPSYLILFARLKALIDSPEEWLSKIKDAIESGITNKVELCEKVNNQLRKAFIEKEKRALLNINNTVCLNRGNYKNGKAE